MRTARPARLLGRLRAKPTLAASRTNPGRPRRRLTLTAGERDHPSHPAAEEMRFRSGSSGPSCGGVLALWWCQARRYVAGQPQSPASRIQEKMAPNLAIRNRARRIVAYSYGQPRFTAASGRFDGACTIHPPAGAALRPRRRIEIAEKRVWFWLEKDPRPSARRQRGVKRSEFNEAGGAGRSCCSAPEIANPHHHVRPRRQCSVGGGETGDHLRQAEGNGPLHWRNDVRPRCAICRGRVAQPLPNLKFLDLASPCRFWGGWASPCDLHTLLMASVTSINVRRGVGGHRTRQADGIPRWRSAWAAILHM